MEIVNSIEITALYRYNDKYFLSFDDSDQYFESIGEQGYNGIPELVTSFDRNKIPVEGKIWKDSYGFYPNRGSSVDYDNASLVEVRIV